MPQEWAKSTGELDTYKFIRNSMQNKSSPILLSSMTHSLKTERIKLNFKKKGRDKKKKKRQNPTDNVLRKESIKVGGGGASPTTRPRRWLLGPQAEQNT